LRNHWLNPNDTNLRRRVEHSMASVILDAGGTLKDTLCKPSNIISYRAEFLAKECEYNLLVMDFHGKDSIQEFPAILISRRGKEISRFHRWVRPSTTTTTGTTTTTTGVDSSANDDENSCVSFPQAIQDFVEWLEGHGFDCSKLGSEQENKLVPCIAGSFDLQTLLPRLCSQQYDDSQGVEEGVEGDRVDIKIKYPNILKEWCNLTEVFNKIHALEINGLKGALAHLKLLDLVLNTPKHGFAGCVWQMHAVENVCKVVQDCWQLLPNGIKPNHNYDENNNNTNTNTNMTGNYDKDPCSYVDNINRDSITTRGSGSGTTDSPADWEADWQSGASSNSNSVNSVN